MTAALSGLSHRVGTEVGRHNGTTRCHWMTFFRRTGSLPSSRSQTGKIYIEQGTPERRKGGVVGNFGELEGLEDGERFLRSDRHATNPAALKPPRKSIAHRIESAPMRIEKEISATIKSANPLQIHVGGGNTLAHFRDFAGRARSITSGPVQAPALPFETLTPRFASINSDPEHPRLVHGEPGDRRPWI